MTTKYDNHKPVEPDITETKTLGRWGWCCGHATCSRVYPHKVGMFYQGSGFSLDEAKKLADIVEEWEHDHDHG